MNRTKLVLWGGWGIIGSFLTPQWLTITFLNITGLIYRYDDSMDKGTAGVFGVILLLIWIFVILMPVVLFLKEIKHLGYKKMISMVIVFAVSAVLCMAMFHWDLVGFWIN